MEPRRDAVLPYNTGHMYWHRHVPKLREVQGGSLNQGHEDGNAGYAAD